MNQDNNKLKKIFKYFSNFDYFPTFNEIHTFFPVKISKKELGSLIKAKKYTPPQYSITRQISKKMLENWKFRTYIKFLSIFPQIKLIGLSGSIAMMNAKKNDDIDLFIITAKKRLFTARLLALVLAQLLNLRRSRESKTNHQSLATNHYKGKVCLNLFFDESDLTVPKYKKTEFVAHEILQMKPIINKDNIYERFLQANRWVFELFPNAQIVLKLKTKNLKFNENLKLKIKNFGDGVESLLKNLQLKLINKHRTTEIITDSQLWFHPKDFEKKMKY